LLQQAEGAGVVVDRGGVVDLGEEGAGDARGAGALLLGSDALGGQGRGGGDCNQDRQKAFHTYKSVRHPSITPVAKARACRIRSSPCSSATALRCLGAGAACNYFRLNVDVARPDLRGSIDMTTRGPEAS